MAWFGLAFTCTCYVVVVLVLANSGLINPWNVESTDNRPMETRDKIKMEWGEKRAHMLRFPVSAVCSATVPLFQKKKKKYAPNTAAAVAGLNTATLSTLEGRIDAAEPLSA